MVPAQPSDMVSIMDPRRRNMALERRRRAADRRRPYPARFRGGWAAGSGTAPWREAAHGAGAIVDKRGGAFAAGEEAGPDPGTGPSPPHGHETAAPGLPPVRKGGPGR